jgi:hypothetical protein
MTTSVMTTSHHIKVDLVSDYCISDECTISVMGAGLVRVGDGGVDCD